MAAFLGWGLYLAWAAAVHLPEQVGITGLLVALPAVCAGTGLLWFVPAILRRERLAQGALMTVLALGTIVPASALWPGGISCARFGLTVIGGCPVPAFDFVIGTDGVPRPRTKSHLITLGEVKPLLDGGPEHLILAIGWDGVVRVEETVKNLGGVQTEILRTGEAFARYNALRAEGKRVAILAHTTC